MTRETQSALIVALASCARIPESEIGRTVAKRLNKCLSVIRESTPDVTIEEMRARYRMHRKLWPACEVTPESLSKHWPALGSQIKPVSDDSGGIPEPQGWRPLAVAILIDIDPSTAYYLATQPWPKLPEHIRRKIAMTHTGQENVIPFQKPA